MAFVILNDSEESKPNAFVHINYHDIGDWD